MKKIIFLLITTILCSCTYPKYSYVVENVFPENDTLKTEIIINSVNSLSSADHMLTTTKYKSPENVLNSAFCNFKSLYEIPTEGLLVIYRDCNNLTREVFIPIDRLNSSQKVIFDKLREKSFKKYIK